MVAFSCFGNGNDAATWTFNVHTDQQSSYHISPFRNVVSVVPPFGLENLSC